MIAARIAGHIESWLRPGIGRSYVAEAVIQDLRAAGYVIRPLFATAPMIEAGFAAVNGNIHKGGVEAIWRAMAEVDEP